MASAYSLNIDCTALVGLASALIAMLQRPEGATIAEIVTATKGQSHTVRGAFAGALKKKLGLSVTSEKVEGGERVYRLDSEAGR